jgi:hypothetical protein
MPDYGHELAFGAFITPQSRRPQEVVALAQLSERVGGRLQAANAQVDRREGPRLAPLARRR